MSKVHFSQIELASRTHGFGQERLTADKGWTLWMDSEYPAFVFAQHGSAKEEAARNNGKAALISWSNIKAALLTDDQYVAKNQPLGTPEFRDTADGRKYGTAEKAKTVLAERIEARASNKSTSKSG